MGLWAKEKSGPSRLLIPRWFDCCAVNRLQLYLGDSLRKNNWCHRLKMPLEERDQRAPRLRAGHRYSAAAIGS